MYYKNYTILAYDITPFSKHTTLFVDEVTTQVVLPTYLYSTHGWGS